MSKTDFNHNALDDERFEDLDQEEKEVFTAVALEDRDEPADDSLDGDFDDIDFNKRTKTPYLIGSAIVGVAAAFLVVGAFWTPGPVADFSAIKSALQKQDKTAFLEYVNVEQIIEQGMPVLVSQLTADQAFNASLEVKDRDLLEDTLYFALNRRIEQKFGGVAVSTSAAETMPLLTAIDQWLEPLARAFDFSKVKGFETEVTGDQGLVRFDLFERAMDRRFSLEFRMEKKEHWQLVEWTNIEAYVAEVASSQGDQLAEYNRPIVERLEAAVEISAMELMGTIEDQIELRAQVASRDGIQEYTAMVRFFVAEKLVGAVTITGKNPGETASEVTWEERVTLFDGVTTFTPEEATLELELQSATFGDGSVLKRARSFAEIK